MPDHHPLTRPGHARVYLDRDGATLRLLPPDDTPGYYDRHEPMVDFLGKWAWPVLIALAIFAAVVA